MFFWGNKEEKRKSGGPEKDVPGDAGGPEERAEEWYDLTVFIVDDRAIPVKIRAQGEDLPEQVVEQLRKMGLLKPNGEYRFVNWPRSNDSGRYYCCVRELKGSELLLRRRPEPQRPPVCYYGCPNPGRVYDHGMPAQQKEIIYFDE